MALSQTIFSKAHWAIATFSQLLQRSHNFLSEWHKSFKLTMLMKLAAMLLGFVSMESLKT